MIEQWVGMDLGIDLSIEVVYAHSKIESEIGVDIGQLDPPTPEEKAAGRAVRTVRLSADEAWLLGVCLGCGLALHLHPDERRTEGSKRRYCRAARRAARR